MVWARQSLHDTFHTISRHQIIIREKPDKRLCRQLDTPLPMGHQIFAPHIFAKAMIHQIYLILIRFHNLIQSFRTCIITYI